MCTLKFATLRFPTFILLASLGEIRFKGQLRPDSLVEYLSGLYERLRLLPRYWRNLVDRFSEVQLCRESATADAALLRRPRRIFVSHGPVRVICMSRSCTNILIASSIWATRAAPCSPQLKNESRFAQLHIQRTDYAILADSSKLLWMHHSHRPNSNVTTEGIGCLKSLFPPLVWPDWLARN
jgi:hypothetical protein